MSDNPYVLIGTPAYNSQVHTDYVHTLLSLFRAQVRYSLVTLGNESLITRARNSIISKFHENKIFTHLLFLDGDIFVDGAQIKKLLDHNKDVIGAPVPLKGTGEDGQRIYNVTGPEDVSAGLTRVERVGTAVFMLSRAAVDALIADAEQAGDIYPAHPHRQGVQDAEKQYDVFRAGVRDGEYLSEDFWVCRRLRDLGFEIFVDFSIPTRHNGMTAF